MKLKCFCVNPFGENTYIIWDEFSKNGAIIDPGMCNKKEQQLIDTFVSDNKIKLEWLINTHLHIDHAAGISHIKSTYGLPLSSNAADEFLASRLEQQAAAFGFPYNDGDAVVERNLSDNEKIIVAGEECIVLHIPGHSPGHIALYFPNSHIAFSGDALFQMSIGRTDLPGGNYSQLIESITNKLLSLPGDTIVYPGHGPKTSIKVEAEYNPYL